jgi:hypothetical protein
MGRRSAGNALIKNVDVHPGASISLSKLDQDPEALPGHWYFEPGNISPGPLVSGVELDPIYVGRSRTIIVTAAVKTLFTAPVVLVPAPAAGAIIVDSVAVFYTYNTAAFGSIHDLLVRYTDGSGTLLATVGSTGFIDQTASSVRSVRGISTIITPVLLAPVVLCVATENMTCTGTSSLSVTVHYHNAVY